MKVFLIDRAFLDHEGNYLQSCTFGIGAGLENMAEILLEHLSKTTAFTDVLLSITMCFGCHLSMFVEHERKSRYGGHSGPMAFKPDVLSLHGEGTGI
jgi:hypothetical protein